MTAIMCAAQPLAPNVRGSFLEAIAQALRAQPMLGDGVVHRVIAATQREFFDPPWSTEMSAGKYR